MTIREIAVAKLQKLSEPLLQEITDFIDFVIHKHQTQITDIQPNSNLIIRDELLLPNDNKHIDSQTITEAWTQWFETVEQLETFSSELESNYQQLLINKYRQQGLEL
jgi:hypothetical protein